MQNAGLTLRISVLSCVLLGYIAWPWLQAPQKRVGGSHPHPVRLQSKESKGEETRKYWKMVTKKLTLQPIESSKSNDSMMCVTSFMNAPSKPSQKLV